MRRLVFSLLSLLAIAAPAMAQQGVPQQGLALGPAPVSHPDLYARMKVAGFAAPVEIHQSGMKTRMDLSEGGVLQSYIADRDKGVLISMTATGQSRVALVFPLDHNEGVVPLPLDLGVLTAAGAQLQTVGASIVNGRSCRLMSFSGYLNQGGMICATPDNIILRMTSSGRREPLFEVTELTVARQDPKWFKTPPDYQVAVVPAIGGASGNGPASVANVQTGSAQTPPDADPLPKVIYSKPKTKP